MQVGADFGRTEKRFAQSDEALIGVQLDEQDVGEFGELERLELGDLRRRWRLLFWGWRRQFPRHFVCPSLPGAANVKTARSLALRPMARRSAGDADACRRRGAPCWPVGLRAWRGSGGWADGQAGAERALRRPARRDARRRSPGCG